MSYTRDECFMYQAILESRKAQPLSSPNPSVGAIIVKNNQIISSGYTQPPGKPHAEVMAIRRARGEEKNAEMFVTLEPCVHYGKTPPCADLIIKSGIKRVVIGMQDPNPVVKGKGIQKLKKAGIEVVCGVLKRKILEDLQWYIKYTTLKLPYVTLKAGASLDGKIADYTGLSRWITLRGLPFAQKLREINDAILVGVSTIIADNPLLTYRGKLKNKKKFYRIILDSNLSIPLNANVLKPVENHYTIIATSEDVKDKAKFKKLERKKDVIILTFPRKHGRVPLLLLLKKLGEMEIARILVEGGSEINFSFFKENLVDKFYIMFAPKIIGGKNSKSMVGGEGFHLHYSKKIKEMRITHPYEELVIFENYIAFYNI